MWDSSLITGGNLGEGPTASSFDTPLTPYLDTDIRLFIHDGKLLKQIIAALKRLKFSNLSAVQVNSNYFNAMRQLFAELKKHDGVFLVNNPPPTGLTSQITYTNLGFSDFFEGVASFSSDSTGDSSKLLGRCLPVFIGPQDPTIRENLIKELLPHGIMGAFMLQPAAPGIPLDTQIEERTQELFDYFLDYFRQRDNKLAQFKEYRSAAELKEARIKAGQIMRKVAELKAAKDYDRAVALCRQAIDVLPSDPEAYLEGGRILVRKRRFTSAMAMFRDAEAVAEASPEPNQEIGNLRVEQVRDHVRQAKANGQPVDQEFINSCLGEAVENYGIAMEKAEAITAFDEKEISARREASVGALAENMLSLGLASVVGEDNPHYLKIMGMARDKLDSVSGATAELAPQYYIQFGLMAFSEGDYDKAETELFKACKYPQTFEKAGAKLNFVATQMRKIGRLDQAIRIYKQLLEYDPTFKGYVLLNLATALKSKSLEMLKVNPAFSSQLERESFQAAVESLYLEPLLPKDGNFYHNSIIAPVLERGQKLFSLAVKQAAYHSESEDPSKQKARFACRQACQALENLFSRGKQGEAIRMLFKLAKKLPIFFLEFDRHSSPPVLKFTAKLHPVLMEMPDARMQKMGKICGILIKKGQAASGPTAMSGHPELDQVITALNQNQLHLAVRLVAGLMYKTPQIIKFAGFVKTRPVMELCVDINQVVSQVDMHRFIRGRKPPH